MDQDTARNLLAEAVSGTRKAPPRRRRPLAWLALALVLVLGAGIGVGYVRLTQGPLRIDGMSTRVADAIAASIGPGWRVDLKDSALELDAENSLALRVAGLDVFNPDGALVVRAPLAVVSLDTWGLTRLSVQPRSIEFRDIQMTALVHGDGSIAFAASSPTQADAAKPHTLPSVDPARGTVSPVSAAVASIFGVVLDSAGVIGALNRARITNGRLILIDDDARQRAVFERVNGLFHRDEARDARLFELRIDGPHGEWRFGGDLHEEGEGKRSGTITLDDLPIDDMLLLSGQSKLPVETDLKLSARADVALHAGRIETMTGEVHTSAGNLLIDEKDFNPVTVETLRAQMTWDEAARSIKLEALDYQGAGNSARLTGAFTMGQPGTEPGWTLAFTGSDAVLRGATAQDAPVHITAIEGAMSGRDGGVSIDSFALKGPGLDGRITGTVATHTDDGGLTLRISAKNSEGRPVMRLWPEHIAPGVRNYLVDFLRGGSLDSAEIGIDMSGTEVAEATKGGPLPDHSLNITFAVSEAGLTVSKDAPPLSHGRLTGSITGRTTTIEKTTAEIRMPDNHGTLSIRDGSFLIRDPQPNRIIAQIGLRLAGGADTFAALLQTEMFKGLTGTDIDPSQVKGQADLRIDFPLDVKHVPDLADLPVVLSGSMSEISLDKVFGKDRFEAGKFALNYDRSGFSLKGDGKVLGAPISIDLRQPKPGAPGEALVLLTLDESFRAKKGLPVSPQLTGSIPARITVPIGRPGPGKPPVKIEADLARASVDGVLPGWTKAAGKPGKLALTLVESQPGGAVELRDIALDAGPTTLRGSATVAADGHVERADFGTAKISTGDDMKIQLDHASGGYKVSVKGAVADARPFLAAMKGGDKGGKDPNPKEIDADIALNILTGFNGESLTGVNLKLAMKGGDVRAAQLRGKFGPAPLAATVTRGERGVPLLSLETTDSGSALRFLDVYRRMYGGKLSLALYLNDGPQNGVVKIQNFILRDEPALSRIVASGGEGVDARGRKVTQATDVDFDRMRADFTRDGSRVSFSDASISNPVMGFTMGGWLDSAKERTKIDGTFVPLYGLNNVFAQVPIVGPLLGGDKNEGLFAVNFSVSGPIAKPVVNVNPLSAVAPGFLRKLFGAGGGEAYAGAPPAAPER